VAVHIEQRSLEGIGRVAGGIGDEMIGRDRELQRVDAGPGP
jgi:hypothetical protein